MTDDLRIKLREARWAKKLTQGELARRACVNVATIVKLENLQSPVSIRTSKLQQVTNVLGLQLSLIRKK